MPQIICAGRFLRNTTGDALIKEDEANQLCNQKARWLEERKDQISSYMKGLQCCDGFRRVGPIYLSVTIVGSAKYFLANVL
jgi:hypothetical protein